MENKAQAPLLETLARRLDCAYLSDLKYLGPARRRELAELVRAMPEQEASCREWNDALNYLGGEAAALSAAAARAALLELLGSSA